MNRLRQAVVLVVIGCHAGVSFPQNGHDEGIIAGNAAKGTLNGLINEGSATAVLPPGYYNANPPQSALYSQPNLDSTTRARIAYCSSPAAAGDLTCEASTNALRSAATPRPPVLPGDATVQGAQSVLANPAAQGFSVAGAYSACTTRTQTLSPAVFDTQSCHNYYLRALDNACAKTLTVQVDWLCPPGSTSGPTRSIDAATGTARWTCILPVPVTVAFCTPPLASPTTSTLPPNAGLVVCTGPDGKETPAPTRIEFTDTTLAAVPRETDQWENLCAGYEARVPPGLLPPDGVPLPGGATATGSGPIDKCERLRSQCTQPPETRLINDSPVARACWQWTHAFDCVSLDPRSDCGQPRFGQCTQIGDPLCIDADTTVSPPACTARRIDYRCKVRDEVLQTLTDCGTQRFCADGSCWDTTSPPDTDFARTVAYLEAQREAGKYLDPATLRVFKGFDNRCKKKLFGLTNCCNKGGSSGGLSNFFVMSNAVEVAGVAKNAIGSTYTFDALFASEAPGLVIDGFEFFFSLGNSSMMAGLLAGELSAQAFLSALIPGPWTAVMLVIQFSGILDCDQGEQMTAIKRDSNLCVDIGEYCSRRLRIVRTCIERTHTYCCFNSRLSRIMNEQGRRQLGRGWGGPQNPQCDGFTVAELQSLDFSRMDLREFYAEIAPTLIDAGAAGAKAAAKVPSCYFGDGKC